MAVVGASGRPGSQLQQPPCKPAERSDAFSLTLRRLLTPCKQQHEPDGGLSRARRGDVPDFGACRDPRYWRDSDLRLTVLDYGLSQILRRGGDCALERWRNVGKMA
jgi:hypothetical protein